MTQSPLEPLYRELAKRFPGHVSGNGEGLFLVVSEQPLSPSAYNALSATARTNGFKSLDSDPFPGVRLLGEGDEAQEKSPLTVITLRAEGPQSQHVDATTSDVARSKPIKIPSNTSANPGRCSDGGNSDVSRETCLSPAELILLIETIDPLVVVSTSMASAKALADAYHAKIRLNAPQSLLGRPLRCFEDFDSMIKTDEGKHSAWKLLKNIALDRP